MDPLSIIASTIAVVEAISSTYKAIQYLKGLPKAFNEVNQSLPLVKDTLEAARSQLLGKHLDEASAKAVEPIIKGCEEKANALLAIFRKIDNGKKDAKDGWALELYRTIVLPLGKAHRAETLMQDILKWLKRLAMNQLFKTATQTQMARLDEAIQRLAKVEQSVPDSDFEKPRTTNVTQTVESGAKANQAVNTEGTQNNTFGHHFEAKGNMQFVLDNRLDFEQSLLGDKEVCLRSLSFRDIDARRQDISSAHPDTCNWFFTTAKFQQWRERSNLSSHNGVLWIKGKPGAGKSTLMKHTLGHCRQDFEDHIIAAYFFNARGDKLEKTPLGMLRSLSYQLLKQEPSLYEHFVPIFREKRQKHRTGELEWRESELKEFLLSEIQRCQSKPLLLLIDALDECNQPDVRNVVKFLEELSIKAIDVGASLNICLSSRHYPSIGMKKSLDLVIEEEKKHDDDIAIYVRANLREQDDQIEERILKKASGVFMWVILVVAMLDQAFDEGKVEAMHQKLSELPGDLEQVFETLLSKDNSDKHETIFLLQCVLFARRALTPEELYFAMISGTNPKNVGAWDRSKVTSDVIQKRITHSSKGLIEIRKGGEDRTVQFIHESVNDFLLRNQRLQSLDHALELNAIGTSHDRLRACCMTYLMMSELPLAKEGSQADKLFFDYPFLEYASTYVLDHAEEAQRRGITQQCLVHYLQEGHKHFERFRHFHNIFERIPDLGCDNSVTLLYTLSLHGYCNLVKIVLLEEQVDVNAQGGLYSNALQAASAKGHEEVVQLLLEKGADVNAQGGPFGNALQAALAKGYEQVALLENGADVNAQGEPNRNAFQAALARGHKEVVQLLLEKGADVNAQGGPFGNALQLASAKGNEEVVQLLLEKGADVNAQGGPFGNALQLASAKGHEEVVQLLLEKGADVNAQGGVYRNALQAASAKGREEVVQLLLEKGADVNAQGGVYGNALQAASAKGREEVVQLLLEKGADVNAQGGVYGNALQAALAKGREEVVQLLLEKGADVNAQGGIYGNALQAASAEGDKEVVQLLLEKGADVNAQGGIYGNALQAASAKGDKEVVQLLLEKGADVNAQGGPFGNALQVALLIGDKEVVQLLLEKGADVNAQGEPNRNAFQAALAKGHEEVVQLLLEKGADVNAQGEPFGNALQAASAKGDKEVVQLLLEKGADVNAQGGLYSNALQAASAEGYEEVVQLLLEKGADVNAQGGIYGNALQAALLIGDKEVVQLLLEKGADVNAQGGPFGNALQAALAQGDEQVVQLLLEKGADVNAQGGLYGNALQAALVKGKGHGEVVQLLLKKGADVNAQGGLYGNALQAALAEGDKEVVQLLLKKGADVNAQGGVYGNALQAALANGKGYEEVVQLLLKKGADVNAQGGVYGNALQAALANGKGYEEVVQLLLKKGADVNAQGGLYGNALQAASAEGYEEVVQLLLEKGADVNAQGGPFGNALQAASAEGYEEVVQLLLEKGADVNAHGGVCGNALQVAKLKTESDLNRNSAVYHPLSTGIVITTVVVFVILLRMSVWEGIGHASG